LNPQAVSCVEDRTDSLSWEIDQQMRDPIVRRWARRYCSVLCALALLTLSSIARASENHGQITFNGSPVPGATITATQGSKTFVAISSQDGSYSFPDLPDGTWKIKITMTDFATLEQSVTVSSGTPGIAWELKLLPVAQILAKAKVMKSGEGNSVTASLAEAPAKNGAPKSSAPAEMPKPSEESSGQAADGLLVNGSSNNAATSQFSLAQAFGNTRKGVAGL
jgi:hypothetical protein